MADIFIAGIGRQPPKKFDLQLKESEKQLLNLKKFGETVPKYQTIEIRSLHSIKLSNNQIFLTLKSEFERFNEEVKEAIDAKKDLLTYPWKYTLYMGLRNLLRIVCDTQDANVQQAFLKQASDWFYDELQKKQNVGASRPGTTQVQLRPETSQQRLLTSSLSARNQVIRPDMSQKMNSTMRPETSQRFGLSRPQTSYDSMMPSEFKVAVFQDYESGSRTKYGFKEPPYNRINDYERKLPNQIFKPFSSHGSTQGPLTTRPGTSSNFFEDELRRSTSPFRNHDPAFKPYSSRQFPMFVADQKVTSSAVEVKEGKEPSQEPGENGEQKSQDKVNQEEEKKPEPEEEEEEGEEEEHKVALTERKTYTNDRLTGYVQLVRDQLVPLGDRSSYAFYSPNGEMVELQAEQRWRETQHKQVIKKREREEIIGMIDEWAHAKSRVEDESVRKGEAMQYGSLFESRAFSPRPRTTPKDILRPEDKEVGGSRPSTTLTSIQRRVPTVGGTDLEKEWPPKNLNLDSSDEDEESGRPVDRNAVTVYREREFGHPYSESVRLSNIFDYQLSPRSHIKTGAPLSDSFKSIELEMDKMKIARIREMHGNVIKGKQAITPAEGKVRTSSLTVFQNKSASMKGLKKPKPLSIVAKSLTAAALKESQLNEIAEIKKTLAKSQTAVSMKSLSKGLLLPETTPRESLLALPSMGSRLMANPFVTEKKKKTRR